MPGARSRGKHLPLALAAAIGLACLAAPASAQAQEDPVSSTGKGIAGGALLGAEAVLMVEAAFEVKPWWAYLIGGLAGAGAGGAAGYAVETLDEPVAPMLMLVGGLGLVIPATIAVLSATSYQPGDYAQDAGVQARLRPLPGPTRQRLRRARQQRRARARSGTGSVGEAAGARQQRRAGAQREALATAARTSAYIPGSLVSVNPAARELGLGVPALSVSQSFSAREQAELGLRQVAQVRLPLVGGRF